MGLIHISRSDTFLTKNSKTLGEYIRRWRMEQGLLIRQLADILGVTEDTVINWDIRGMVPAKRHMDRLIRIIPGVGNRVEGAEKWFNP